MWFLTDVIGPFSTNVSPFSHNVIPATPIFSGNLISKPLMLSRPATDIIEPIHLAKPPAQLRSLLAGRFRLGPRRAGRLLRGVEVMR